MSVSKKMLHGISEIEGKAFKEILELEIEEAEKRIGTFIEDVKSLSI